MDSRESNSALNLHPFADDAVLEPAEEISTEICTSDASASTSTMESSPAPYSFTVTTARKLTKLSKASKDRLLKKIEETWKLVEHYIKNHVTEESQFREIERMLDNIRVKLLRMSKTSRNRLPNIKKDRVVKGRNNRQNRMFAPKKMQSSRIHSRRVERSNSR